MWIIHFLPHPIFGSMNGYKIVSISLLFCLISVFGKAQSTDTAAKSTKILLVPYQSMMYFSDADKDIARYSGCDESHVRNSIANSLEIDLYHRLLVHFDAVSLLRATSLNGEEDLRRIYAATSYTLYEGYKNKSKKNELESVKKVLKSITRKKPDNPFHITDSLVMVASIGSEEVFSYLQKKHHEKYVLFITQVELNTDQKNMIEWTKQQYQRTFTIHYNLFDFTGKLIRAETITMAGGNENRLHTINDAILVKLADKIVSIVEACDQ
jgi:hypothetical protein